MLIRQGDIFIARIDEVPAHVRQSPLPHGVLAHGEVTGHSHKFESLENATVYVGDAPGELFAEVANDNARIIHDEHDIVELKPGSYRIWRQREYTPERIVTVVD